MRGMAAPISTATTSVLPIESIMIVLLIGPAVG
jgi:hypothetical protein